MLVVCLKVNFHCRLILPTLTAMNLTRFTCEIKLEEMCGPLASAEKVECGSIEVRRAKTHAKVEIQLKAS